ncbi:flp pilus assembly protein CpaB [Pontibacillus yanchengensis]|uniref:Flp pilus assembly protein CpaB n=2 Tax=Pontibacillus yanchengensis TaxID=462910 RepID=A0ACC7VL56_9BACI|nr:flagella basal body P-ring formation protein FlgA [Pontibacillus yanchengensis]MYL33825.1 flp pilus assembly protein CpaB [Pontibacillus yanchengensis]MYL55718.1 flp pilus assembly protein CpaB [Pontibacillus yanchengensis]
MLESKRRAIIFLVIAFALAAIAGYLVLDKVKSLNSELGGMTEVYIAEGNIPSRSLISESQITVMEIPNKFVTDSHVTDKQELQNKVLVVPLNEGDMITSNMVKPVSNLRNENHRLVALYRSEKIQFDQVIEALDRVDIIVSDERSGEKVTEVFMKDVPVAFAEGDEDSFAGVAVEVNAKQAPKLIHIQNYAEHIRVLKANVGRDGKATNVKVQEGEEQSTSNEQESGSSNSKEQSEDSNNDSQKKESND